MHGYTTTATEITTSLQNMSGGVLAFPVKTPYYDHDYDETDDDQSYDDASSHPQRHRLDKSHHPNRRSNRVINGSIKRRAARLAVRESKRGRKGIRGRKSKRRSRSRSRSISSLERNMDRDYTKRDSFDTIDEYTTRPSQEEFVLPANEVLSPRADVWVYLFLVCIVGAASVSGGTGVDTGLVALQSVQATISGLVATMFRYGSTRAWLTRPLILFCSWELLTSAFLFVLWCICMGLYHVGEGGTMPLVILNEVGSGNINVFSALWVGGALDSYLMADLFTGTLRGSLPTPRATVSMPSNSSFSRKYSDNGIPKLWFLLFLSSTALLSFSLSVRNSYTCNGLLQNTQVCASTVTGIISSIFALLFCLGYVGFYRLSRMTSTFTTANQYYDSGKIKREGVLAVLAFTCHAINLGLTVSPGGAGTNLGDVFVISWLSFLLVVLLMVLYLKQLVILLGKTTSTLRRIGSRMMDHGQTYNNTSMHSKSTAASASEMSVDSMSPDALDEQTALSIPETVGSRHRLLDPSVAGLPRLAPPGGSASVRNAPSLGTLRSKSSRRHHTQEKRRPKGLR